MASSDLESMDDAALDKKRAFWGKFNKFSDKIRSPISFFSLLTVGAALSYLTPFSCAFLFLMCAAAGVSIGAESIGNLGKRPIHEERKRRTELLNPSSEAASKASVSLLPDLSDAFRQGVAKPVAVKTLRLRNSVSAFLS